MEIDPFENYVLSYDDFVVEVSGEMILEACKRDAFLEYLLTQEN